MINIGFLMEKILQGDPLLPGEAQALAQEVTRAREKQAACAEELGRREEADVSKRKESREFAERARVAEEEVTRLRKAFEHAKQQRDTDTSVLSERVKFLEEILRDAHYALTYQPDLSSEQIASVIAREVEPHPAPAV